MGDALGAAGDLDAPCTQLLAAARRGGVGGEASAVHLVDDGLTGMNDRHVLPLPAYYASSLPICSSSLPNLSSWGHERRRRAGPGRGAAGGEPSPGGRGLGW